MLHDAVGIRRPIAEAEVGMATREQVLRLVDAGHEYDEIARRLDIRPGLAYLIATGLPADGGDAPAGGEGRRPGSQRSSQHLADPEPAENPTSKESVIAWIKHRVNVDPPLRAAESRRDAAPGKVVDPDGEHDLIDELSRDHNQVKALLEQMSAIPGKVMGGSAAQMSARKSIVDMITVALSEHESLEEEYLWPAVRKALRDGDRRAEAALTQEKEGKDVFTALGKLDGDDDEFDELVERLTLAARTHVAFEERVFLDLAREMSERERRKVGRRIHRARAIAPTRPHPHAPQHSPAVKAAGLPAAAMDKLRDTVGNRPADRRGRADGEGD
jgi:hemerythrin-like domain-containing protein